MIEQYRDELITALHGGIDEHQVAEDREAVAKNLLTILHRQVRYDRVGFTEAVADAEIPICYLLQHSYPVHRDERALSGRFHRRSTFPGWCLI